MYADNSFVTLTFSDEHLPAHGSVDPRDVQLFLKRLRKAFPSPIRYFAVGEYGDETERPHYHLALFGFPHCRRTNTRITRTNEPCCEICSLLQSTWGLGNIYSGTLELKSAQYVAGYINKKMTRPDDFRLKGRWPEFARMSLRPGLGLGMMHELASVLLELNVNGEDGKERMIDVPLSLQHGQKAYPLGRYLRRKLRTFIGRGANAPDAILHKSKEELQLLRQAAQGNKISLKTQILKNSLGKRIQVEADLKRNKKRGHL